MQRLLMDHRKRLKVLYEYVADKLKTDKVKVRDKKGGEEPPKIKIGDKVFMKNTRTRKAKELPRYEEARVIGVPERNIIPVKLKNRKTKVAIKNVKRPPQVVRGAASNSRSNSRTPPPESGGESRNNSDQNGDSSDED